LSTSVHLQPVMPAQASWLSARHLNTWAICKQQQQQQEQQQMHVGKWASCQCLCKFGLLCSRLCCQGVRHYKMSDSYTERFELHRHVRV
jgi:hypothetical protein